MEWKRFVEIYDKMLEDENVVKVPIIPANNWLYCNTCKVSMKVEKNGVEVVSTEHRNATATDKWICPECGYQVLKSEKRWF
jgi:transposase-like protein